MSLISVKNFSFSQGVKPLFNNISFEIEPGSKIALTGVNGCGKTTLLSKIASLMTNPDPAIAVKPNLKISYLKQSPDFSTNDTILDHLFNTKTEIAEIIRDYESCLDQIENNRSYNIEKKLAELMVKMDLIHAWDYEQRVRSILSELNINHLSQKMKTLSGGMVKKVSLAQIFIEDMDLLILDEPTNHLDIKTIEWLENMLKRINTTVLMVTHDRYFLDKICTAIMEIDQQSLFTYRGNYQCFLEQKSLRSATKQKEDQRIKSILRVELEWLKKGPKARSTKQKARKKRIDEIMKIKPGSEEKTLDLGVQSRRLGKKILKLTNVSKSFDGLTVINNFSRTFQSGDKIGIIGPNGSGKTTLLNIITQKIEPDSGVLDTGINTVFGYFDQQSISFDLNLSVLSHIKQYGEYITTYDGTRLTASKVLERFLFTSDTLKTPVGKLSGGERRRLHLVCILLTNPNFLIFDEPTNDLDIKTLSILEDFLINFQGCLVIVSHDRYFMDRVVDQLLIFTDNSAITTFHGGYSDYLENQKNFNKLADIKNDTAVKNKKPDSIKPAEKKKLSFKENQELKTLEQEIEMLELEKKELDTMFSCSSGSPEKYREAGKRIKDITFLLNKKMNRWEELAEYA
ncbi:MAG: ABC-F family ATP-binding cassette domain-containing protein [bacterium]|nr:ABC-F family ATP-binding cassette domain-containing protein [bacterium]